MKHTLNLLLHILIAVVLAAESAGIAYVALDRSTLALVLAAILFVAVGVLTYRHVTYAPEIEGHTQLATAVEDQDMRRIPRWWGTVPAAIAVLGALLAWLILK